MKIQSDIAFKAYRESYDFNRNLLKNQDIIIREEDPKYCYHFLDAIIFERKVIHFKDCKINELIEIIQNSEYYFTMMFYKYKIGNIIKAQENIIKANNPRDIFYFALKTKEANKNILFEALLKIRNIYYIERFIKEIEFDSSNYTVCYFI